MFIENECPPSKSDPEWGRTISTTNQINKSTKFITTNRLMTYDLRLMTYDL
jgi:hypothetical protein